MVLDGLKHLCRLLFGQGDTGGFAFHLERPAPGSRRLESDAAVAHGADRGELIIQDGVSAGISRFHDAEAYRNPSLLNRFYTPLKVGMHT